MGTSKTSRSSGDLIRSRRGRRTSLPGTSGEKRVAKRSILSRHYSMVIQWSDEDRVFIVSLPEFGDFCKTHGKSYAEAVKNGQEVLELLIEDFESEKRRLPRPRVYRDVSAA